MCFQSDGHLRVFFILCCSHTGKNPTWPCFLHVHTDVFKTQTTILKFYADIFCKQSLAAKTQEADEGTVNLWDTGKEMI